MDKIEFGDCRETMRRWKEQGVKAQTCVTSPPYYGLRDYGTAKWEGGDAMCDHRADGERRQIPHGDGRPVETDSYANVRALIPGAGANFKSVCGKCGARRIDAQIGLEETPEAYIKAMVEVFRCVWDVLADDGTLWLNLGDSYSRAPEKGGSGTPNGRNIEMMGYGAAQSAKVGSSDGAVGHADRPGSRAGSLAAKQLIGIPWRVAFALRADGWYLRQDIIWHKPNPMPESVQDRCTKAHEYIFLLSKSQKYYFDNEAIAEPLASASIARLSQANLENQKGSDRVPGKTNGNMKAVGPRFGGDKYGNDDSEKSRTKSGNEWTPNETGTRNKRSVWTVTTKPYKGAHFATFPTDLITPCILAGAPAGGIVLDPFMGSGTTAAVAIANGRDYLGCELNPAYKELQDARIGAPKPTDLFGKPV